MITELLTSQFIRFLLVGLLNTAFGYSIYFVLVLLGFQPQVALLVSFAAGVLWNYFTTARLVFDTHGARRFPAYIVAYMFIYAINAGSLQALLKIGLSPLVAQAVLLPLLAVLAYILIGYALTGKLAGR